MHYRRPISVTPSFKVICVYAFMSTVINFLVNILAAVLK